MDNISLIYILRNLFNKLSNKRKACFQNFKYDLINEKRIKKSNRIIKSVK